MSWSHLPGPPVEWFIGPVDVVHGTNYVVPPTRRAGRVVTVHDLSALRYPQLCDASTLEFPRLVRRAVAAGAWVHTPSRYVADEVIEELAVDPGRVRAVHHGIPGQGRVLGSGPDSRCRPDPTVPAGRGGDDHDDAGMPPGTKRYVLAVGTVEPRKDYPSLVHAFDMLAEKLEDVALVIAGVDGWGAGALDDALVRSRRSDRIARLGYVTPARLERLLARAAVVAYPSVYEGFGFVPLEAMAAGVPVVATAVGAIPEVAGDGALLVPPADVDSLAEALESVLSDEAARSDLVQRGRLRANSFTWEACAEGLANLYSQAAP
jgi:glycosyltransferase involved in cell wall biosynthesis